MILFGVTTGRHEEMDWLFRGGVAPLLPPEQWERLARGRRPKAPPMSSPPTPDG